MNKEKKGRRDRNAKSRTHTVSRRNETRAPVSVSAARERCARTRGGDNAFADARGISARKQLREKSGETVRVVAATPFRERGVFSESIGAALCPCDDYRETGEPKKKKPLRRNKSEQRFTIRAHEILLRRGTNRHEPGSNVETHVPRAMPLAFCFSMSANHRSKRSRSAFLRRR